MRKHAGVVIVAALLTELVGHKVLGSIHFANFCAIKKHRRSFAVCAYRGSDTPGWRALTIDFKGYLLSSKIVAPPQPKVKVVPSSLTAPVLKSSLP